MHPILRKILKILGSRLARNSYLWAYFLITKVPDQGDYVDYPKMVYYSLNLLTLSCFFALAYLNNLVLVPLTLGRKKYITYLVSAAAFTFSMAYFYTFFMKWILITYPKIKLLQVSIVASPITTEMTWASIFHEMQTNGDIMLMWVMIFTLFWYLNEYAKQEKRTEELLKKQVETELAFLKNQINPHFLFNTLNNLYGLTLKKSDNAADAILKLSLILRYLLYESNVETIAFEKEKEIMEAYIALELLRMDAGHDFHFSISADKNTTIPPLLWLSVLENVFKHGTRFIDEKLFIDYRFVIEHDKLTIFSKNNYRQSTMNGHEMNGGIGMENLKKRLTLIYPNKHIIDLKKDDSFYTVEIQVSLK